MMLLALVLKLTAAYHIIIINANTMIYAANY
jgi:hypothetical protein